MKSIVSCLLTVGIAALVAGAQANPKAIVPGKQLGKLNIGDLMSDMKWLKKADYGDAWSGHQWMTWEAKKADPRNGKIINSLDVFSSLNEAGKYQIRIIRSTSPTFVLNEGVKVGSSFQAVKESYSKLVKVTDYVSPQFLTKVALYDDAAAGVAFEFKVNSSGNSFLHDKCLAIWVHEPAADLIHLGSPVQYLTSKPSLKSTSKKKSK